MIQGTSDNAALYANLHAWVLWGPSEASDSSSAEQAEQVCAKVAGPDEQHSDPTLLFTSDGPGLGGPQSPSLVGGGINAGHCLQFISDELSAELSVALEAQELIHVLLRKDAIRVCLKHCRAELRNLRPHHLQPHQML